MIRWTMAAVGVLMLWGGAALAQTKPCEQGKTSSPEKIQGQVVRVDRNSGKVALRGSDGKTYEFQASNETLKDVEVGHRLEARLRETPKCQ